LGQVIDNEGSVKSLADIFSFLFWVEGILETNVRVKDNSGGEKGVHDGVEGAADEGSDGEGNETGGDKAMLVSLTLM
jgi:hypothetical protein